MYSPCCFFHTHLYVSIDFIREIRARETHAFYCYRSIYRAHGVPAKVTALYTAGYVSKPTNIITRAYIII